MWLLESLQSSFTTPTHEWRLQVFRMALGFAVLWKALASIFYGEWTRLESGRLDHYLLVRRWGTARAGAFTSIYKPQLVMRAVSGMALLTGYCSKVAIGVICLSMFYELVYEYRFNTIYLMLCSIALLPAQALGSNFAVSDQVSSRNTWAQVLVVFITCHLYFNSAWLKARSSQFSSGLLLAQVAHGAAVVRSQLPLWEYRHPTVLARTALSYSRNKILWRALAVGTILLEFCLPPLLVAETTRPFAIVGGLMMHAAFMAILPIRLAPFTVTAVASYVLFVP